jgi:hypothetical protein
MGIIAHHEKSPYEMSLYPHDAWLFFILPGLVMTKTLCELEHGTFSSLIDLLKMVIFHSYVSLQEGNVIIPFRVDLASTKSRSPSAGDHSHNLSATLDPRRNGLTGKPSRDQT